ncbi:MAG TPA: FAD-dependent thymidylate synthase [Acidobacteriota bacterium]|nr:FAD-dependent thymidylate synthase [Acidobacteriota bacterium]
MSEEFTPEEIQILSKYVTNPTGDTFCVTIPGLAGPIYARYSRAVTGLRRTLLKEFLKDGELNVTRTQELIERILNEYGDDSVGELEGAHLALEQVSNVLTKLVEDRRIGGSPIEQSTRYVFYDQKDKEGRYKYYRGEEILNSPVGNEYVQTMDLLFDTYASAVQPLTEYFRKLKPMEEAEYGIKDVSEKQKYAEMDTEALQKQFRITYNADLRTKACDILRDLLPAATLTNVGLFGNGRYYQHLLTRLYSHELSEANRRSSEAHAELNKVIPKFVKRAKRDEYWIEVKRNMRKLSDELLHGIAPSSEESCVLLSPAGSSEELLVRTLAVGLYPYSKHPLRQLVDIVRQMSYDMRSNLLETCTGKRRSRRDRPGRAFETGYPLTFDIQADFGAYRDLQRHRILTQERQLLNPHLGFDIPEEIESIGFKQRVLDCYERSQKLHEKMARQLSPELAQYAVLLGFKIRWIMGMNFREAMHFIELRTTPQGHPRYRHVSQQMMDAIRNQHPELAATIQFADYNEYYWSRAESEARQRRKERETDERFSPQRHEDNK